MNALRTHQRLCWSFWQPWLLWFLGLALLLGACEPQEGAPAPLSRLDTTITRNTTLPSGTRYLLRGIVRVRAPARLTLQAGVQVFGEKASRAILIIEPGAQLIVQGTATRPVVFTSAEPAGSRQPGDWGGIAILGQADINLGGGQPRYPLINAVYGGGNNASTSGNVRYLRISFAGAESLLGTVQPGLYLGALGSGTQLAYVQTVQCAGAGFEFQGGRLSGSYLLSADCRGHDFVLSGGYQGRLQFLMARRSRAQANASGSYALYSVSDVDGSQAQPQTVALVSQFSAFGPMANLADSAFVREAGHRAGVYLGARSGTHLLNSLIAGFPRAVHLADDFVTQGLEARTIYLRTCFQAGNAGGFILPAASSFDADFWFQSPDLLNRTYTQLSTLLIRNPFELERPDYVPGEGSALLTGADYSVNILGVSGLQQVPYVGSHNANDRWSFDAWVSFQPQFNP